MRTSPRCRTTIAAATGLLALLLAVPASADAYAIGGAAWPGRTIRYAEALPASYDWSLSHAVAAWNASGARVRFVKARSARDAQLRISIAGGASEAGGAVATVGRRSGAYVHLNRRFPRTLPPGRWVGTGRLLAHELGHVLGLQHGPDAGCEIMDPSTTEVGCPTTGRVGWYMCRWVQPDDARGAIRLYGGRLRGGPTFCPIEPAPGQVRSLRAAGGAAAGAPVTLTWRRPLRMPRGASYAVAVYPAGRCGASTERIASARLGAAATRWTQPTEDGPTGDRCYELRVLNRWGWGPAPRRVAATSWRPAPDPPVLDGELVEHPDTGYDYRVRATVDAGSTLWFARGEPGACVATWPTDGSARAAEAESPTTWLLAGVPLGGSCLSFFAVDASGRASTAVTREVAHASA
jgi:hypothetical protein